MDRRDADDLVGVTGYLLIAVGRERDDDPGASAYLLDVREHLLVDAVPQRDRHDRQGLVDERVRPVLHLTRGGALGVDVGELFQLECALERRRVVHATAEMQEIRGRRVPIRESADLRVLAEHRVDERWQVEGLRKQLRREFRRDGAAPLREVHREQKEVDEHRGVCLRRGDADLGTGVKVDDVVGEARGLAPHHVAERQEPRAPLLRRVHRRERVGGLSRLGHRDRELTARHDRVAVAVLRRDLDVARDLREALDEVLADERRVERGTTRDEGDARERLHEVVGHLHVRVEDDPAGRAIDAAEQSVGDRARLLGDLLGHEVLVAGLRRADGVELDLLGWPIDRSAVLNAPEPHALLRHHREVSRLEERHVARVLEQRGHVGGDEVLGLPVADDDAAGVADARCHDRAGMRRGDEDQRGGAVEAREHRERGVLERFPGLELVLEQVHDDLGVGLR